MKTIMAQKEKVEREFHLIDVKDKILGRAATRIAGLLKGKHKISITPHVDSGDAVIVINAEKIRVTGKKLQEKTYKRYSGYPGGLNERTLEEMLKRRPQYAIYHAVKGMLPKNKLGRRMLSRLKVYAGQAHPHAAQKPTPLEIS